MPRRFENLLVTGGAGFIGVNFIRWLFTQPDCPRRIINVDKLTYAGNPLSLLDLEKSVGERYVFRKADICDAAAMKEVIETYAVDAIAHFGQSHVDCSIVAPDDFVRTNIIGTYTLPPPASTRPKSNSSTTFHRRSVGSLALPAFNRKLYAPNHPLRVEGRRDHRARLSRNLWPPHHPLQLFQQLRAVPVSRNRSRS